MKNPKISPRIAITLIALAAASASLLEWRGLYALEHPKQEKTNCVTCHSDARTLRKIAEKADDPLYLVHHGDLKALPGQDPAKAAWGK